MENGTLLPTAQVFFQTLVNRINPSSSPNEIQGFDTLLCETEENKPYKIIGFGGKLVVVGSGYFACPLFIHVAFESVVKVW